MLNANVCRICGGDKISSVLNIGIKFQFTYTKKYKIKKLVKNMFLKVRFYFTHIMATSKGRK